MIFLLVVLVASGKLLSVVEIARHGARNTLVRFPWDSFEWEVPPAEMTRDGTVQHYLIGRELRSRYVNKDSNIPGSYNLSRVFIRSTDVSRTFLSVQAQMFGFFNQGPTLMVPSNKFNILPPFEVPDVEKTIEKLQDFALPHQFQPVSILVEDIESDLVLAAYYKSCPRVAELISETENEEVYLKKKENYEKNTKKELEKNLNVSSIEFNEVAWTADGLECLKFAGFDTTKIIQEKMYQEIIGIRNYTNSYLFDKLEARNLAFSELFIEILQTFQDVAAKKSEKFLSVYMSHDTHIVGLLKLFGVYDGTNPSFASVVLMELHEENGNLFVKMFYNDQQLTTGFCDLKCPLEKFKDFVNSWAVSDVKTACVRKGTRNLVVENMNYHYLT
jgi:hypothetical protein